MVRLMDGGLDRSSGRVLRADRSFIRGWGGAARAGCAVTGPRDLRAPSLGTSPCEEEGRPIMTPGSDLTFLTLSIG